jgi:endonuclease YncB( thermonuclease family)
MPADRRAAATAHHVPAEALVSVAGKSVLGLALIAVVGLSLQHAPTLGPDAPVAQPPVARPSAVAQPPAAAPQDPDVTRDAAPSTAAQGVLQEPAGGGDGDSWRDTAGREYRLGLVNTPETNECFGSDATSKRTELTAGGFRADVYATDTYGRSVAVVRLPDGTNLNVWLARHGFADDRYLERFRGENPGLATELDGAFAAARAELAGLWGPCSGSVPDGIAQVPPAPAPGDCHPAYLTCIPVTGDGSGRGAANDLDCGSLGGPVTVRTRGVDPYRLDGQADGVGCE